jgi:hypothetical protein
MLFDFAVLDLIWIKVERGEMYENGVDGRAC